MKNKKNYRCFGPPRGSDWGCHETRCRMLCGRRPPPWLCSAGRVCAYPAPFVRVHADLRTQGEGAAAPDDVHDPNPEGHDGGRRGHGPMGRCAGVRAAPEAGAAHARAAAQGPCGGRRAMRIGRCGRAGAWPRRGGVWRPVHGHAPCPSAAKALLSPADRRGTA